MAAVGAELVSGLNGLAALGTKFDLAVCRFGLGDWCWQRGWVRIRGRLKSRGRLGSCNSGWLVLAKSGDGRFDFLF
jgi:hypothetical protein